MLKSSADGVELVFDGRYDTARKAKWCTVDNKTGTPVWLENLMKDDVDCVSQRLETIGVRKGLEFLLRTGVKIGEVIHDDDRKINFLLNSKFKEIYNSLCGWHKTKNVKKNWEHFKVNIYV